MADAVPVSDVLCEAMEYLTKLGSNLKVRSENLKEKRIRKDKLRNTHAVKKAANKVLLICELAKKSLENVETGVTKVLKQIDLTNYQSNSDGGNSSYKSSRPAKLYDYIVYKSRRLRIRRKVDIKHFTSVKVYAKPMPISMQDKYPVYLDCKLYRFRQKEENSRLEKIPKVGEDLCEDQDKSSVNDIIFQDEQTEQEMCDKMSQSEQKENNIDEEETSLSGQTLCKQSNQLCNREYDHAINEISHRKRKRSRTVEPDMTSPKESELLKNDDEIYERSPISDCDKISQSQCILEVSEGNLNSEDKDNTRNIKDTTDSDGTHKNQETKCSNKDTNQTTSTKSKDNSESYKQRRKSARSCLQLNKNKKFKHIKIDDESDGSRSSEVNTNKCAYLDRSDCENKSEIEQVDKYNKDHKDKNESLNKKYDDVELSTENVVDGGGCELISDNSESCVKKNKEDFYPKENTARTNTEETENNYSRNTHLKDNIKNINETNKSHYDESQTVDMTEKNKSNHSDTDSISENIKSIASDADTLKDNISKPNLENENSQGSNTESRPFLRCVSIDKLMKPNVVKAKRKTNKTKNIESEKCPVPKTQKDKKSNLNKESISSAVSTEKDENEYWMKKREEVKQFKPKKFIIDLRRLPESLKKVAEAHNLKRITKYGSVIYEVSSKFDNKNEGQFDPNSEKEYSQMSDTLIDINSAKNALCDDSDSDKSRNIEGAKNELNESCPKKEASIGGNEDNISKKQDKKKERRRKKEKHDSVSYTEDNNQGAASVNNEGKDEENSKSKSSLLCDSTDDIYRTPEKKSKNDITTPPSRRKHIMESMRAKKMLLTYSSSSDTEDEQLRNALKEIRDSLLKEISTDEEKEKNKNEKVTSESDDNPINIRNKRKHALKSGKESKKKSKEKSISSSEKMGHSKTNRGSSSQNSDTQESIDKDIDGLTNLSSLVKKRRRRGSTSTDRTQSSSRTRGKMSKVPQISEEGFLKAEDSSEAASLADSDVGEEVELPAVSMSELNGDSIGHLAKDDLLDESDSSSSHNKSSQDVKEEVETDEDNVKSRRRKGHATISSDSEAGGSRKKDATVRYSDFDDSDESSEERETGKRTKRKKKSSDSDASVSLVDEGKKKRRRIRNIDESDGSGSETENEGRNKHGRKNIRKVMSKNQLEEATKKAAREEKERLVRIAERQKLYNNLEFDESGKPDEVMLDKVVLDFDPETKEPLIQVDNGLVKKLKPHQANGIKFMWDACFESVKRIKKDKGSGCILAHCMGLGKTLQVVSLTHTLLIHSDLTRVNRVLVVCPLSTVLNWVNEYKIWLKHAETDFEVDIYELSRYKQNSERAWQLQQWFSGGGVCVLGYEMFRNLSADNNKKFKKKMLKNFQESLVDPGPDLVVCDEGHLLKNEKTSLSQAMNRVKTLRRIVLTGTPLQNNLKEYYCMVQFVKPNLLGKYNEYLNRFVNPITNGQYTDSTEHDIRIMKRRSHVLHKMLDGAVQRRDYGVLAPFLPPKHEYVLFITLTEIQITLYQHYLDKYSRRPSGKSSGFLFPDFQSLQRIWTHPLVLKYNSERYEIMQQKKREREEEDTEGSLVDFIDDESTAEESSTEESSDSLSDMSDDSRKKNKKSKATKKGKNKGGGRRGTRANPVEAEEEVVPLESDTQVKYENPTEWWMSLVSEDELEDLRHSNKLVLLFDILRQCEAIGDKLLVFSQSLYSLDLIEFFLGKVDEATQEGRVDEKLNGHVGSWSPGVDYFRLDGSTSCENRSIWCKNFNREDNPRARLFLISTRAGGLGINLVAANRVIIFDVSWNPSHDVQSIFRVYRFGQKKPCYVYRFLAMGTMEEKIYERQVTKQAISKRVIDEQQIDRHYAENDLAELYKFEPRPPMPRELPSLPKDRLFAEMLKEYEVQIYKYHEHDSLLENKEEETLTEEERKAAWEDFENEKTRPPPMPFSAYNGMVPTLLAQQQQQQLAFAALAGMLRKDMPNINDDQLRNMASIIYNSNPALMQKMNEIYKFAQPGMMPPAMMNPVLNPGGGAGGSSGLQYEPPWQRQQQQQHQMQLQRLLQQQQNMGAKYYAGGLGSRDPVAMALQQQRAREMMLGERGRPRGRPPGPTGPRPRPPPHAGEVVNLDSD